MDPSLPCATNADAVAPAGAPSGERLQQMFRASLRDGRVHPLMRLVAARLRMHPAPRVPSPPAQPSAPAAAAPLSPLQMEDVRRRVADLPALPRAALRALQTLRRDDASLEEIAEHVGCDASLTARVLRLANSPFYGVPGRIGSPRDAAQVLGRRTLESVLTLAAVGGQLDGPRSAAFDAGAFWRHALASAIAARALARAARLDEGLAFAAGLLQDIGLLAMSVYFPDAFEGLAARARAADLEFCAVERRDGLTPHAEVGASIAAHWRFPAPVVEAIQLHHAPPAGHALAACVHVADALAHALDLDGAPDERVPLVDVAAWALVAPPDEGFDALMDEVEAGVAALGRALGD